MVAMGMSLMSICCLRIKSSSRSSGPSYCARWKLSGEDTIFHDSMRRTNPQEFTARTLERELDLRFQSAIVGRLVESFAVLPARNLVRKPEIRRGDVPDNRSRVCVIEQVPHRNPDAQVEAVRSRRAADQPAQPAAAHRRQRRALPRGSSGTRVAGYAALLAEADRLGDPQIHIELSRTASVVAREQPLARCRGRIQQIGRA